MFFSISLLDIHLSRTHLPCPSSLEFAVHVLRVFGFHWSRGNSPNEVFDNVFDWETYLPQVYGEVYQCFSEDFFDLLQW